MYHNKYINLYPTKLKNLIDDLSKTSQKYTHAYTNRAYVELWITWQWSSQVTDEINRNTNVAGFSR